MGPEARLAAIAAEVVDCEACPRLAAWRRHVAASKRAAYADETYWGRPLPGFGDAEARVLVVGLAPAAHGANRTGRMFTGDRSGEWLYRALHRVGFANQPTSRTRDDGLALDRTYVTACVRCAPPDNRPAADEWARCRPFLEAELAALRELRVIVALGGYAFGRVLAVLADRGVPVPKPRPRFAHGAEARLGPYTVVASYHPSQQNTFTGRLTEPMFDAIWQRVRQLRDAPAETP